MYPIFGENNDVQYKTATFLLLCVMISCPLMLFVIPCCFRHGGKKVEEQNELEFANIAGDEMGQPMIANAIQRNSDVNASEMNGHSADRAQQMRKLEL